MPSTSEKQRKFMGAELDRLRSGKKTRTGMSEDQLSDFASKSADAQRLLAKVDSLLSKMRPEPVIVNLIDVYLYKHDDKCSTCGLHRDDPKHIESLEKGICETSYGFADETGGGSHSYSQIAGPDASTQGSTARDYSSGSFYE